MHQRPNTIEVVDSDENKLIEVSKHPFGIVIAYVQAAIGMIAAAGLILLTIPSLFDNPNHAYLIAVALLFFALIFVVIGLAVSTYIYRQSRVILTDRNITQILQSGLFSRKVSQLNIVNVEDVTSVQSGFISTFFNYGILRIETAGEQSNFEFTYCPNSGHVAKLILDAREKMLGQMDEQGAPVDVKTSRVRSKRGGTVGRKQKSKQSGRSTKSVPDDGRPYVGNADDVAQVKTVGSSVISHSKKK